MEITEKERLMLDEKKKSICETTLEILEIAHDPKNSGNQEGFSSHTRRT
jgi:hypothetical protein